MSARAVGPRTDVEPFEDLFPARLHYILEQVEAEGKVDVIAWRPHGMAFLVKDKAKFVNEFLPYWFRQKKWASFQRQLNHYNFQRITAGLDRDAYYHPFFVKDDRSLCKYIRRVNLKGTGPRQPSRPEDQPDFYRLADPGHHHAATLSRAASESTTRRSKAALPTAGIRRAVTEDNSRSASIEVARASVENPLLPLLLQQWLAAPARGAPPLTTSTSFASHLGDCPNVAAGGPVQVRATPLRLLSSVRNNGSHPRPAIGGGPPRLLPSSSSRWWHSSLSSSSSSQDRRHHGADATTTSLAPVRDTTRPSTTRSVA